eukprot:gene12608-6428_t
MSDEFVVDEQKIFDTCLQIFDSFDYQDLTKVDVWHKILDFVLSKKDFESDKKMVDAVSKLQGKGDCITCSCYVASKLKEKTIPFLFAIGNYYKTKNDTGIHSFIVCTLDSGIILIDKSRKITKPIFLWENTPVSIKDKESNYMPTKLYGSYEGCYKLEKEPKETLEILRNGLKVVENTYAKTNVPPSLGDFETFFSKITKDSNEEEKSVISKKELKETFNKKNKEIVNLCKIKEKCDDILTKYKKLPSE